MVERYFYYKEKGADLNEFYRTNDRTGIKKMA